MYRPPEDIRELRAKNLPWVVSACVVVTLVLAGALFYYLTSENLGETLLTTPTAAFLNYRVESTDSGSSSIEGIDTESTTAKPSNTGNAPFKWPQPPRSASRKFRHAAVSSRNEYCAEIGRDVLIRGGNAVDAAIATVICEGGLRPHATGFGGGMVMLLHDRAKNETTVVSAYSSAPRSVTEETFAINHALAEIGYSSIATPGFLHGIWTAFRRYGSGRVAWQDLLLPTVHLLERGTPAGDDLVDAIRDRYNEIMSERSMSVAFNITPLDEGELMRSPVHAAFLRRLAIATDPAELFYRGDIANQIVHEMKQRGGLLSKIDLASYGSNVEKPLEIKLPNGFILKGPQPPSAFTALAFLVETLMRRYSGESNVSMNVSYMKVLLKAQYLGLTRLEQLGDLEYMLNDSIIQDLLTPQNETVDPSDEAKGIGIQNLMWKLKDQSSVGSHVNVVDGRGKTVALSSSLNERFGSVRRSMKGGFVWNNEMSSFTMPDKEKSEDVHVNAIEGRKRPRTSMMPLMLFDYGGQLILSIGITGSLNSILAAAQVLLSHIVLGKDVASSLSLPRVFATSEGASFEVGLPMELLTELRDEFSLNPILTYDSMVHCMQLHVPYVTSPPRNERNSNRLQQIVLTTPRSENPNNRPSPAQEYGYLIRLA